MRPSKKDEILQKSLRIFYQHGFNATGVDFIVKLTGISKSTIYSNFENKDALICAVLSRRDCDFMQWLVSRVEQLSPSPEAQIYAVFDALAEWFAEEEFSGCMFINASSEFQDPSHPVFVQCQQHKNSLQKYFQSLAELASLSNPVDVAKQVLLLKEGAIIAAKLKLMPKPAQYAKRLFQQANSC